MSDFANATIEWGQAPDTITLLELYKQQQGILDNTQDVQISMYLDIAGQACERYIDNVIDQREVSESFKNSRWPIALRYYPTQTIESVTVDGVDVTADYELFFDTGIDWATLNRCDYSRTCCFEQMVVTYVAGYDPLPADLGQAIVQASIAYDEQSRAGGPLKRESVVGVGSLEYDTSATTQGRVGTLPAVVIGTLEYYRRMYV